MGKEWLKALRAPPAWKTARQLADAWGVDYTTACRRLRMLDDARRLDQRPSPRPARTGPCPREWRLRRAAR